jgi:hypothetical protein
MANNAAKNINSLESQTIVPTATMLGLLILGWVRLALGMGRLFLFFGEFHAK